MTVGQPKHLRNKNCLNVTLRRIKVSNLLTSSGLPASPDRRAHLSLALLKNPDEAVHCLHNLENREVIAAPYNA